MLVFNKENIRTQTYRKTGGGGKEQLFTGMKFRRAESNKGKKEALAAGETFTPSIASKFFCSDALWESLGLEEKGFYSYYDAPSNQTFLILTSDNDSAKIFSKSGRHKEGTKKGRSFSNDILEEDLQRSGILVAGNLGNQFLQLEEVDMSGVPEGDTVYLVVRDNGISAEAVQATNAEDEDQDDQPGVEPSLTVPEEEVEFGNSPIADNPAETPLTEVDPLDFDLG